MARGPASDRKGYYPFPHDLLADLPDGAWRGAAASGVWAPVAFAEQ